MTGRSRSDGNVETLEYVLDWERRVFPGEEVYLLGDNREHCFEYRFDDSVHRAVSDENYVVEYALHFEDHEPISGSVPMRDLHVY